MLVLSRNTKPVELKPLITGINRYAVCNPDPYGISVEFKPYLESKDFISEVLKANNYKFNIVEPSNLRTIVTNDIYNLDYYDPFSTVLVASRHTMLNLTVGLSTWGDTVRDENMTVMNSLLAQVATGKTLYILHPMEYILMCSDSEVPVLYNQQTFTSEDFAKTLWGTQVPIGKEDQYYCTNRCWHGNTLAFPKNIQAFIYEYNMNYLLLMQYSQSISLGSLYFLKHYLLPHTPELVKELEEVIKAQLLEVFKISGEIDLSLEVKES